MTTARSKSLDVLRGVALVLVLGRHMPPTPPDAPGWVGAALEEWRRAGWVGVDLFFVLSGFLVSGLLFREYQRHGDVHVGRFLARRGFKIYPAFYVLLAATALYTRRAPASWDHFAGEALFLQGYLPHVWSHTWSLAVEEHFYLLLALATALLIWRRVSFAVLVPATAAVAIIELAARVATAVLTPNILYLRLYPTHLRLDSLLFGVLLSYWYQYRGDRLARAVVAHRATLAIASAAALAPCLFRRSRSATGGSPRAAPTARTMRPTASRRHSYPILRWPDMLSVSLIATTALGLSSATIPPPARHIAQTVKITVLSTMLAGDPREKGIGEWGFAALVEVDGRRILYDTGERPETVLNNARELGLDLSDVTDVVLSHSHWDHVGGLLTLRRELARTNPSAVSRAHVASGIWLSRRNAGDDSTEGNPMLAIRPAYEATGGTFVEHHTSEEIAPGVWLTGPVPRQYAERNWFRNQRIRTAAGFVEDTLPEDQALVIDTPRGLIVLTGCGHAGVVNIVTYARRVVRDMPVVAVVGGLHLFAASDSALGWTAGKLRDAGMAYLLGAHCTGIEAVYRLRTLVGLTRKTAVVGAVGSSFSLATGIDPLLLAQ